MPPPSSTTFWALMDRWRVSDDQALELVGYQGKLPTTGRRPRFRLTSEQAHIVSTLLEIDVALATAEMDTAWLHRRSKTAPRSPLDLMRAGATDDVLRSLTQAALRASLSRGEERPTTSKAFRSGGGASWACAAVASTRRWSWHKPGRDHCPGCLGTAGVALRTRTDRHPAHRRRGSLRRLGDDEHRSEHGRRTPWPASHCGWHLSLRATSDDAP
jgi:hypothetical protein